MNWTRPVECLLAAALLVAAWSLPAEGAGWLRWSLSAAAAYFEWPAFASPLAQAGLVAGVLFLLIGILPTRTMRPPDGWAERFDL